MNLRQQDTRTPTLAFLALVCVAIASSCQKGTTDPDKQAGTVSTSQEKADEPSGPTAEGEAFRVSLAAPQPLSVDKPAELKVTLEAKPPYKCNQEYPHKFRFSKSDGVDTPEVVSKEGLELEPKRAQLTASITPRKGGKQRVEGTLSFSVCTEERCLIERQKLALDLDVH